MDLSPVVFVASEKARGDIENEQFDMPVQRLLQQLMIERRKLKRAVAREPHQDVVVAKARQEKSAGQMREIDMVALVDVAVTPHQFLFVVLAIDAEAWNL